MLCLQALGLRPSTKEEHEDDDDASHEQRKRNDLGRSLEPPELGAGAIGAVATLRWLADPVVIVIPRHRSPRWHSGCRHAAGQRRGGRSGQPPRAHIIIAMHGGAVIVSEPCAGSPLDLLGMLIIMPIIPPPPIIIMVQGGTMTVLTLLLVGSTS